MSSWTERAAYDALTRRPDASYASLSALRNRHGTWTAAARHLGAAFEKGAPKETGVSLCLAEDSSYPAMLREIPKAPWGVYMMGALSAMPSLAIVGTRNATDSGIELAYEFSKSLARAGFAIVSGLALGIDAAAHKGALDAGGVTIAVLANGLPHIYPRHHTTLGRNILSNNGALLSEYAPDSPPYPSRFLERNRIVSGLSLGTLLIEAPERSGSLATARFALEQNREVFVVPGYARHPNYRGSHRLIQEGAMLITDPMEIIEALGIQKPLEAHSVQAAYSPLERTILDLLKGQASPLDIDKIAELTKLPTHVALQALSFLIIKKAVREGGEGYMVS